MVDRQHDPADCGEKLASEDVFLSYSLMFRFFLVDLSMPSCLLALHAHSSITFCCSSQVKMIRFAIGFFMAGIVTIIQASTFIVYGETFCQQNNCSFSRGSGTSIAAMASYVMAGMGFFFSSDYPGVKALEDNNSNNDEEEYEYRREPELKPLEEHYEDEVVVKTKLSGELGLPSEPSL
jgi:hypothetical protein